MPRPAWLLDDRLVQVVAAALALEVVAFLAGTLVFPPGSLASRILVDLVYMAPEAVAAIMLVAAGRVSRRLPSFWYTVAAATVAAVIGDAIWAVYDFGLQQSPTPSPSDLFYVASPLLLMTAAVDGFRLVRPRWRDLVDFLIPFAAVLFAVFEYVIEPQIAGGLDGATIASTVECMVTILATLLFTAYVSGARNIPGSIYLVYASLVVQSVAYPLYAYAVSVKGWEATNWVYTGWQLSSGLLILAALVRLRRGEPAEPPKPVERDVRVWLITAGLALVLAVITVRWNGSGGGEAPYVGLAAIAVVLFRLHQTVHQRGRLASELRAALARQERLATTDALTGVANRRAFDRFLRGAAGEASVVGEPVGLLIVDLDHFKQVNDGYGHPVGDATLQQVAARLGHGTRPGDFLARIGGEEFGLVLPGTEGECLARIAERCRAAVGGEPFRIDGQAIRLTASVGGAALPADGLTAEEVARVADRALYEAKRRGRNRVHVGGTGIRVRSLPIPASTVFSFLEELADRIDSEQSEQEHSLAMLELAARLCDALHLSAADRRRCLLAARLHDVGKVAVPSGILTKRGPLAPEEWVVMREHVRVGVDLLDRCAETRDIAPIVAEHHERPDGRGYPTGKAGDAISIEGKILSVADAWTAMLANRPYRAALSPEQARSQLVAGRGSQFDERVVDALLAALDADAGSRRAA